MLLRLAEENRCWGYDKLLGALSTLGFKVDKETIARFLRRQGLTPRTKPSLRPWLEFISSHLDCLVATDFFSVEVWQGRNLYTFYCLFFIQLNTRRVKLAGITEHPNTAWMKQMARNMTSQDEDFFRGRRLLLHNRDTKYCAAFHAILRSVGIRALKTPAQSPDLNAYAERWVRSIKEECVNQMIFWGEEMLWTAMKEYVEFYNSERPHQGLGNRIPDPKVKVGQSEGRIVKCSRLGGLLNFYYHEPIDDAEKSLKNAA